MIQSDLMHFSPPPKLQFFFFFYVSIDHFRKHAVPRAAGRALLEKWILLVSLQKNIIMELLSKL